MSDLLKKKCIPCEGGTEPLSVDEVQTLMKEVSDWTLGLDAKSISKEFAFKTFDDTIQFVNLVAELSETEGHLPDMHVYYDRLLIELSTPPISVLFENDFILAAKIDDLSLHL